MVGAAGGVGLRVTDDPAVVAVGVWVKPGAILLGCELCPAIERAGLGGVTVFSAGGVGLLGGDSVGAV